MLMIATSLPVVQEYLGEKVEDVLAEKLGTSVHVGGVSIGMLLNQLSLEEVQIKDQQKKVVISPTQHEAPLIKTLGKLLAGLKVISGATVLGDGRVAMILDVSALM